MSPQPSRLQASPGETGRKDSPSVADLVTDPDKFDRWQRERAHEERRQESDRTDQRTDERGSDPRDQPPDRA
ncbi:hypothetical protein [Azospirillum thermophilum]|uniref:Uncharacterized protein n=1 Tax=Azospirillum thermophilum TaxID=2202148 RepID=A0A2S2CM02_9PROT|nr:hypothetical protein [Azospirillum thermophilum]AWK85548.1 hypothetical protein DEW08_04645 [Azospirillum thermophilum]